MNHSARNTALAIATLTCATFGVAAAAVGPAAASTPANYTKAAPVSMSASDANIQQMINANMTDHDLDMVITTASGSTIHQVVAAHSGWYPNVDVSGTDVIVVKDAQGVAFRGEFTYSGDWIAGHMETAPRMRYTWHTGPFGGFDFR
ncbi:MAG: hypothetical protein WBZ04_07835 [Candidatus Nanopelagicales bacterium]